MTSRCCGAAAAAMRMPPRPRLAARPTRSPTPGGVRAPGSRASTPTWPPMPRACCWLAATSSTTSSRRPTSATTGSPAIARCSCRTPATWRRETIARIERWLGGGDHRLVVTGKTNLPPRLLGLRASTPTPVTGYTGWRWRPDSPFAGPAWEPLYVTRLRRPCGATGRAGAGQPRARRPGGVHRRSDQRDHRDGRRARAGHRAHRADGLRRQPGLRADRRHAPGAPERRSRCGTGPIPPTGATRCCSSSGGCCWTSASAPLWQTRLRSFGTYDGVLSFRHDVHGMRDYTFLDYQIQNLIPASYDIEDPAFSTNISEAMAARLGRAHDPAQLHRAGAAQRQLDRRSADGDPRHRARTRT